MDRAIESEEGQKEVEAKAQAVKKKNPLTWLSEKFMGAAKGVRDAIQAVYYIMKGWLVSLCDLVASGGLDDLVNAVADALGRAFTSLKDFMSKIWGVFKAMLEKIGFKRRIVALWKKVSKAVSSIFGAITPLSWLWKRIRPATSTMHRCPFM